MKDREFFEVDPAVLRVSGSRRDGADPYKLHRQISKHGTSVEGMPPLEVSRGSDGELVINYGVTRAMRAARCQPGTSVPVEVIETLPIPGARFPTIGELL